MYKLFSPNMLKTFQECPKKFDLKYLQNIQMPVNDEIFEFGKNIHALASYYLRKENIDKMELSLSPKENDVWQKLKSCKFFSYDVINTEYNLLVKVGKYFYGGRLDALVKNNETYYILDYKTGSIPQNPKFDFQTIIYILAVKEFFKTSNIKFVYINLKQNQDVIIEYTAESEKIYKEKLIEISNKIESHDYSEHPQECKCEYSLICN